MKARISKKAKSLGFDAVAFTLPALHAGAQQGLQEYIQSGAHGDMHWMETNADRRGDPKILWPEAQSVIVVGHNYAPPFNPMEKLKDKSSGNISVYAQNRDYHDVIKKKLRVLATWLAQEYGCEVKLFVDTAPVMEKPLAQAAGIGWQGKHTCLVSREFGSWLFLGSIFTTLPIAPSPLAEEGWDEVNSSAQEYVETTPHPNLPPQGVKEFGSCGTCTNCLDICPTQAFTAPGKLDSRRCIAYLTNEHKGPIPLEFRKAIGNRIYGCDDCLAVCPWNKFAKESSESAYHAREELKAPKLSDLLLLDDAGFRAFFSKSPIKRIGRDRFIRNVLAAAGNSEDKSLISTVEALKNDMSPLVAEMAGWALAELQKC